MQFRPVQAACIFGAIMLLPLIPFIITEGGKAPVVLAIAAGSVIISSVLFGLGAMLARTPHSIKSLILCVLLSWVFSLSANYLSGYLPLENEMAKGYVATAAVFVFVFLLGWRRGSRPRQPAHS